MPVIRRVPDFDEGKTFIIKDVFVDYASVFRPNTKYRPEWAVVIRVPQHMIQEFYEVGFRLKQDPNGVVTLRAKRYVRLDNGEEMSPPTVVDCENQPWPESRGLIGNGSLCNVKVRAKYTTYQGVEGLSCFLEGLQVLKHVPYSGGTDFSPVPGETGGWSQQNFQQQPQPAAPQAPAPAPAFGQTVPQQPEPAYGYQQPAAQQAPAPQTGAYVPPGVQPPAQPAHGQPHNPYVPPGVPQGVPTGPPASGNVSQPPQGALGQAPPAPAPAVEEPEGNEYVPPGDHSVGDDVPF